MVCVTECVFMTLCVMTVNESSTTLSMTLAIYDIKLDGHGPRAAKRSLSWSNPVVLTLGTEPSRDHKITLDACNMMYELRKDKFRNNVLLF